MIEAFITKVVSVRPLGNNLSVVKIEGSDNEVVANRREDGSFRWSVDEPVVYVPEGAIVPDDVMQERGYWDNEKSRGLLEGKKYNRVKMRRFGPEDDRVESRGLLFKLESMTVNRGDETLDVDYGADVASFLGLSTPE